MAGDVSSASPVGNWVTATNGVKQTVTFTKDGKVFGDSGCNRFTGGYTVKGSNDQDRTARHHAHGLPRAADERRGQPS